MPKRQDQGGWPDTGFARRLKQLRQQLGLTQAELAKRAGCNKFTVAKLEAGKQVPAWPLVLALAEALDQDCTAFLSDEKRPVAERTAALEQQAGDLREMNERLIRSNQEPRRYHVLFVDDSPEDRATYKRLLGRAAGAEYRFTETGLGEDGVRLCREVRPDCVLLDYHLPDTDGLEVLPELARPAPGALVPVVMLTGQGDEGVAVQAMKRGAQDYLVKERVAAPDLAAAIQSAVEKVALVRRGGVHGQAKQLLPICMYCKKIRDGENNWQQVEAYLAAHYAATFSQSICPHCYESIVKPELAAMSRARSSGNADDPPALPQT